MLQSNQRICHNQYPKVIVDFFVVTFYFEFEKSKGGVIMTLEDIRKEFDERYDDDLFLSLANFIGSDGKNDNSEEYQDDYATQEAVALVRLFDGALRDTIKDPELGGSIYIRYSADTLETVFDQLYADYGVFSESFVQYYDRYGETFLLFYVGDTVTDKQHYMDSEDLGFEETVVEMIDYWKTVMRQLYRVFGGVSVEVREMPADDPEDGTAEASDSVSE